MKNQNILGGNLRRLRLSQNKSQEEIADLASISVQAYRNIETSKSQNPRMSTVVKLAEALDIKLADLMKATPKLQKIRFRAVAKSEMYNKEKVTMEVASRLEDYEWLEHKLKEKCPYKLENLEQEKITSNKLTRNKRINRAKKLAEDVRKKLVRMGVLRIDDPIHDICGLAEYLGIKVVPIVVSRDDWFGLSIARKGKKKNPVIAVNVWDRISVERWIFTVAHELGHLLMHLGAYCDEYGGAEDPDEELEANTFASYFLMPEKKFNNEWDEARGHELAKVVWKVKRIFNVSFQTVLKRLQDGHPNKEIHKMYYISCIAIGKPMRGKGRAYEPDKIEKEYFATWKVAEEPKRLTDYDFIEDRLHWLVREAIEKDAISPSRGAKILRIPLSRMNAIIESWINDKMPKS